MIRFLLRGCVTVALLGMVVAGGVCAFAAFPTGTSGVTLPSGVVSAFDTPVSTDPRPLDFTVNPGDDAGTVAARLKTAGIIGDDRIFRLVASQTGLGTRIGAGEYELRRTMTSRAILEKFSTGDVKTRLVTVPEGYRIGQIVDKLTEQKVPGDIAAAIAAVEQAPPAGSLAAARPAGVSLDGYLLPDSYKVAKDITAPQLIAAMLTALETGFTPEMRQAVAARGLTPHQAITLASIVEREAVKPEEQPIIAAVYLNRLKIGMILQADPTVQYALASLPANRAKDGYWKKDLTLDDLKIDSPYNTYRYAGLPPGPICSPGIGALRAVANPATNDFYYFVAKPDGSHAFARTLDEHNANVARYAR